MLITRVVCRWKLKCYRSAADGYELSKPTGTLQKVTRTLNRHPQNPRNYNIYLLRNNLINVA